MCDIPLEMCRDLLLRLPAESLFRLRAISKGWQTVIDDPGFVKAHTKNQLSSSTILLRNSAGAPFYPLYLFDLEALNFTNGPQTIPVTPLKLTRSGLSSLPPLPVAACNGLMLIAPFDHEKYRTRNVDRWDGEGNWEIWNPLTHERLKLPQPKLKSQLVGYGLGYDCTVDDYKVVVRDYQYDDDHDKSLSQTHVYSLKSGSWRNIGDFPFELEHSSWKGVFVNGALHWLSGEHMIIAFDLGTESYSQLQLPLLLESRPEDVQLDALCGCLVLSYSYDKNRVKHCYNEKRVKHFNGWVMNDYGVQDSWMRLYSFNHCNEWGMYSHVRPVAYMKNKKQLVLQHKYGLFWFDVESNSVKTVSIHGFSGDFTAQICVGSLFRLHDSCERVAAKRRTSQRNMKVANANRLTFCVRDYDRNGRYSYPSHDNCYSSDSNGCNSSSEEDN